MDKAGKEKLLFQSRVMEQYLIGTNAYLLRIEKKHDFTPGQVIGLTVSNEIPPRLYSIASGNQRDYINILYTTVPDGTLTNKIKSLQAEDTVLITEPFGKFTGTDDPAYWIAAGTGLAPFLSMLDSGVEVHRVLIHGSRKVDGFFFQDQLKEQFDKDYIRCCSTEERDGIYAGRLTNYLLEHENLPKEYKYYLCGSSEMVVQTRDILISKGVPFENILSEIYF